LTHFTYRCESLHAEFTPRNGFANLTNVVVVICKNVGIVTKTLGLEQIVITLTNRAQNIRQINDSVECSKYTFDGNKNIFYQRRRPIYIKIFLLQ
jgi:hypothetical protein